MRQLVVTENVSLDGVMSPMGDWFDPSNVEDDLLAVNRNHREAADALVLGRVTYEEFAGYWPHQPEDPAGIVAYINRVAKFVVSGGLDRADWEATTILRGPDELAALKDTDGGDIVITGSCELVHSLAPLGIVDTYRLFVYPVVQGHGRRVFPDGFGAELELTDSRRFGSGVVFLEYRAG